MLGLVLATTMAASRWLGFSTEDEIAIVFYGSKKSMAGGIPMANVLFPGQPVGLIVLPLMLFQPGATLRLRRPGTTLRQALRCLAATSDPRNDVGHAGSYAAQQWSWSPIRDGAIPQVS